LRINKIPLNKTKNFIKPYKVKTVKIPLYKIKKSVYIPLGVKAKELPKIPPGVKAKKIIKLLKIKVKEIITL